MQKPAVLFLCTGNSARSQMAEALLRKHADDRFQVYSAGTDPAGVNPLTIKAVAEIGLPTRGLRSKSVDEFRQTTLTYLIAVCGKADQACPAALLSARERLFWPFDDPAACQGNEEDRLAVFRRVRDEIEAQIKQWLAESP